MAYHESHNVEPKKSQLPFVGSKLEAAPKAHPNNPTSNEITKYASASPDELQFGTVDDWPKDESAQRTRREGICSSSARRDESSISHGSARSSQTGISVADSLSTAKALGTVESRNGGIQDLICVGFGPACLAIAIALADTYSKSPCPLPKVLFIERQKEFSWHSGMQLPSAKMQISFLKDLATPRDPKSPFTFINYLHKHGRLNHFINLGTFLPTRAEYEAYMRWCAEYFDSVVKYGGQVTSVEPSDINPLTKRVRTFKVKWRSVDGSNHGAATARNIVVALGGEAFIPEIFRPFTLEPHPKVKHSSQYAATARWLENILSRPGLLKRQIEAKTETLIALKNKRCELHHAENEVIKNDEVISVEKSPARLRSEVDQVAELEQDISSLLIKEENSNLFLREMGLKSGRQRFVVVGSGQSAAEIFNDLWTRFPDADISLVIRDMALRPSDDSPFVNEIFDPERVDNIYNQDPTARENSIEQDRGTNYSVVRLELLEHIYEQMYMQRMHDPDPVHWRCKIIPSRKVVRIEPSKDKASLLLGLALARDSSNEEVEQLACSFVFVATGYTRNAHEEILRATRDLLPDVHRDDGFPVARNYRVEYDKEKVEHDSGVWLQGCNENTHGLSDTLLSILAVRGGEVVSSIFGEDLARASA